jgi:thioredoxin 1
MILEFTDNLFDVSSGLVVVDFWGARCGPCVAMTPIFESVSKSNPDVTFAKVDTSENQNVSKFYSISAIPTLLFFKHGELVKRVVGFQSEMQLSKVIAELRK